MGGRGRLWIVVAILGVGLLLIGVAVIASVLRRSLVPQAAPTPLPPATRSVVVARQDLPLGALLRPDDLRLAEVPVELVPPRGALEQIEAAAGRLTRYPLVAGELVLAHHLADPTNVTRDLPLVIGREQVLMAFPAGDLLTSLNLVQRGDLVDVLVSIEQEVAPPEARLVPGEEQQTEAKLFTFDALQRVEISAVVVDIVVDRRGGTTSLGVAAGGETLNEQGTPVPAPTPTPAPSQIETRAILLALAPQDALVLKHLKDAGGIIDLVLRAPDATQLFELDPVMSEYLIDRYQLESTR